MSGVDDDDLPFTMVAPRSVADPSSLPPPAERQSRPDELVGRYRIVRMMGRGGMGEVLVAHDTQINRDVAVKRMRAPNPNERQVARFLREASIQGRLEHPAIVPVHEIGRDDHGVPFFAMKRVSGTTLSKIITARDGEPEKQPLQRVLRAFAEVCLAVEFAHVRGIVHRDLKPDNIILGEFGEVYVLDWGVAKILGESDGDFADIGSGSGEHATVAGTAVGTPGYMSPEQVRGQTIDSRADIYTLGCMLFEILAGVALHPAGKAGLQSALDGPDARPSVRAPDRVVPPELEALCVVATHLDPDDRISTARELGDRVMEYLDGDRDLALRRQLAAGHLAKARAVFADESERTDERHRVAMREAAGALALDPTLAGAAELVGRLMLEPPRTTPKEVDDAIRVDDVNNAKETARAGVWAVGGALAFTPLLWWIAPAGSPYVIGLTALLVAIGITCVYVNRSAVPRPGIVVISNTVLLVLVARMFSPVLIAPGVAAVLAMAMALTPRFSLLGSAYTITGMLSCAILGPLALERLGIWSQTMFVDAQGVLFHAPVFAGNETPTIIVGALYAVALVAGACLMANTMRARAKEAARHLHLQAWQLRQLVPASST